MVTQTDVNKLIIRKGLTKEQYEELVLAGEIGPNDLCFVEDDIDPTPEPGSDAYITSGAVYDALSEKVDKVSTHNVVYGTDNQGNQTSYAVNSFGQVDDVQMNGTTIVSNKIAELYVDNAPTQNSTNLVTSGGVYSAIPEIIMRDWSNDNDESL